MNIRFLVTKRHLSTLLAVASLCCAATPLWAGLPLREMRLLPQHNMAKWNVPGANYSGIANLDPAARVGTAIRFALVSDKEPDTGFYTFTITQDPTDGDMVSITPSPLQGAALQADAPRDAEGIAYIPESGHLYISYEDKQTLLPFDLHARQQGPSINVPQEAGAKKCYTNYGFEALTYDQHRRTLWAATEQSLKADGEQSSPSSPSACCIRLLAFDDKGNLARQYAYRTDEPKARKKCRTYAFGISAMTALDDGSLLVLEREFFVAPNFLGSWVRHKIYRVQPATATPVSFSTPLAKADKSIFLDKELVAEFKNSLNLTSRSLANYEGMCLGPTLADGRKTLLLVSDSQGNYGNDLYRMHDYIRVLTFRMPN